MTTTIGVLDPNYQEETKTTNDVVQKTPDVAGIYTPPTEQKDEQQQSEPAKEQDQSQTQELPKDIEQLKEEVVDEAIAQEQVEELEQKIDENRKAIEENSWMTEVQKLEKIIDYMQTSYGAHIKDLTLENNRVMKENDVYQTKYDELLQKYSELKLKVRDYEWLDIDDDLIQLNSFKKKDEGKYKERILNMYASTTWDNPYEIAKAINEHRAKMIAQAQDKAVTEQKEQQQKQEHNLFTKKIIPQKINSIRMK